MFEGDIGHRRSVAVLCIYNVIRSGVTLRTVFMVRRPVLYVPVRLHPVLWSHIGTLMRLLPAEPHRIPQDFYSPLSVSVERSYRPCVR